MAPTSNQYSTHTNFSLPNNHQEPQSDHLISPCGSVANDHLRISQQPDPGVGRTSASMRRSICGNQSKHNFSGTPESPTRNVGPTRRRVTRACDRCNLRRTKCDGRWPCLYCIESEVRCEYRRGQKKRGKGSRKNFTEATTTDFSVHTTALQKCDSSMSAGAEQQANAAINMSHMSDSAFGLQSLCDKESPVMQEVFSSDRSTVHGRQTAGHGEDSSQLFDQVDFDMLSCGYESGLLQVGMMYGQEYVIDHCDVSDYEHTSLEPSLQNQGVVNGMESRTENHDLMEKHSLAKNVRLDRVAAMSVALKRTQIPQVVQEGCTNRSLRYPVLQPLVCHLVNIIPIGLACDLLELYFSSTSSAQLNPVSPYVLGLVFRAQSFLDTAQPRKCQPALLASMLWIAAQTSDAPFVTRSPTARTTICQRLLDLSLRFLNPPLHVPGIEAPSTTNAVPRAMASWSPTLPRPLSVDNDGMSRELGAFGTAGQLDDVATYIHLATVMSASEYKSASISWWNIAWSLARELKLGRELPTKEVPDGDGRAGAKSDCLAEHLEIVAQEEREERRRIWWLLYMVDRHTALCYNRPLFILDSECEGLLLPMNDTVWQSGEFKNSHNPDFEPSKQRFETGSAADTRVRGLRLECRGYGIFDFFLPLMGILGEIVDLHHAKSHPRFGNRFQAEDIWSRQTDEIRQQLQTFELTMKSLQAQYPTEQADGAKADQWYSEPGKDERTIYTTRPSPQSTYSNTPSRMTDQVQARMAFAYGTFIMHVLHILLHDKWDPIELLDNSDDWIASQSYVMATSHAVSTAEVVAHILELDPGLEFMPFFLGIYLLQGSFLLLLVVDKLPFSALPSVLSACQTMARAHEACVVTLNTEYQVREAFHLPGVPFPHPRFAINGLYSGTLAKLCGMLWRLFEDAEAKDFKNNASVDESYWPYTGGQVMEQASHSN